MFSVCKQFEQSLIAMNNSLIYLLQCQQRMKNDTIHTLQVIHQSQGDPVNGSLIHDIPTFDGNPDIFCLDLEARKYRCFDQMKLQTVSIRKALGSYKMPQNITS